MSLSTNSGTRAQLTSYPIKLFSCTAAQRTHVFCSLSLTANATAHHASAVIVTKDEDFAQRRNADRGHMTTDVSERGLERLIVADMTGGQRTRLHGWCINWSGSQATPARCSIPQSS
jgi:hypothetical protein